MLNDETKGLKLILKNRKKERSVLINEHMPLNHSLSSLDLISILDFLCFFIFFVLDHSFTVIVDYFIF